jgi:hypothetical protein
MVPILTMRYSRYREIIESLCLVERGRVVSVAYLSDRKKIEPEPPPRRNVIVLVYQHVKSLVTRKNNSRNIGKVPTFIWENELIKNL